ncbi:hypothetical protein ACLBWZ_16475 [Brucellaceae bacterium C25G]
MDTAEIISAISLSFSVISFIFLYVFNSHAKAKDLEIESLKNENQLRHDFAEKWFCSPIQNYLTSFQECAISTVHAMHIFDIDVREKTFTQILNEHFLTIFDNMDTFCDTRGDQAVAEIKQHLSDFMDAFVQCIEDIRKSVNVDNVSEKRRDLLKTYNNFSALVHATLLAELNAIKIAPRN